ncbi:MAG: SLBB domain-containing protein [bacterium]|nr:SLBB domain-containing protein [bacterium]
MVRKYIPKTVPLLVLLFITLAAGYPGGTAFAQENVSEFTQTFQVFTQSADAYRTFDLSPDELVNPLPDSYTIGPGDTMQIILTGMIMDSMVIQVGPQGDIFVPPAGLLKVEGLSVPGLRDFVDSELSKYLINYTLQIQLIKARRIQVYLLGQVRQPGKYIALAGTSALSLIQTAGSLVTNPQSVSFEESNIVHPYFRALTSGAGRWLEVWRNNEQAARVDIAEVAINGRTRGDFVLEDGDAIYIAPNNHPVIVRGGVSRPGTYEIRRNDTVLDLIAQAGGYRAMMMLSEVAVERPNPPGESGSTLIALNLADPNFNPRDFQFQPGDILRVPEVKNQVYVLGAVWGPTAVDYHEGWTVLDYLAVVGGPTEPSDPSVIRVIRFPLSDEQEISPFNLKALYMGEEVENIPIEPGDMIWVPWDNQPYYGTGIVSTIGLLLQQAVSIVRLFKDY